MSYIKAAFNYLAPIWSGNDNKPSIRRLAAMALIVDFVINVHNSVADISRIINLIYLGKTVDSGVVNAISSNFSQTVMILGIEASLISALLALTTVQNIKFGPGPMGTPVNPPGIPQV